MLKILISTLCMALLLISSNSFAVQAQKQDSVKIIDTTLLQDIIAFHKVHDHLVTAGLPTPEQFMKAKEAGVEVVINVIPPLRAEPQPNLAAIYNAGLVYFNIPFDTENPIVAMEAFIATMNQLKGKNTLIHCAANWRVSFLMDFYYQITTGKVNKNALLSGLPVKDIMEKYARLASFITTVEAHYNVKIAR